jgi:hypothetical protein
MHDLDQLQRWMQTVLMHPGGVEYGIASTEAREVIDVEPAEADRVVTRSQSLGALERLAIYNRAYFARLIECLRESYPVLAQTLGEDAFDSFAIDYLQQFPSRSYTLNHLGKDFPRYLAESRPTEEDTPAPSWPDFVIDLARLEWTYGEVFDGPGIEGQPTLSIETLRAIPVEHWPEAIVTPVPCLRLLELHYPVHRYYSAARRKKPVEIPEPGETLLAITRQNFVIRRFELSRPQFVLLEAITAGQSIGEAIGRAAESAGDDGTAFARKLRGWFRNWTAERLFLSVRECPPGA